MLPPDFGNEPISNRVIIVTTLPAPWILSTHVISDKLLNRHLRAWIILVYTTQPKLETITLITGIQDIRYRLRSCQKRLSVLLHTICKEIPCVGQESQISAEILNCLGITLAAIVMSIKQRPHDHNSWLYSRH